MKKATNNIEWISAEITYLQQLLSNGKVYEAYNELKKTDQKYKQELENDFGLKITFHDVASRILDELEKNKQNLQHIRFCITGYEKIGNIEPQIISRVKYADALCALGYVKTAEIHLKETCDLCQKYDLHTVKTIAFISYANILSLLKKPHLASKYFKDCLSLTCKTGHNWYCIYGKIYQEIHNLRLNYKIETGLFEKLIIESKTSRYYYLTELTFSAICVESTMKNETVSLELIKHQPVLPISNLFYLSNLIQTDAFSQETINNFLAILGKCEGIKLYPEQIISTIKKLTNHNLITDQVQVNFAERWLTSFSSIIENNSATTLKACDYKLCEARCCYDGVYLQEGEEEKINQVVNNHSDYFKHLPLDFIVDGSWGKIAGRKTAVRSHAYLSPDYPDHFTKTRCVFAELNGACSLQKASIGLTSNNWNFKPKACRIHPLQTANFDFTAPPTVIEEDKFDLGVNYPGYVSYTPCGINRADGNLWLDELKNEIKSFQCEE